MMESSDSSILSVDEQGMLTGLRMGKAEITVSIERKGIPLVSKTCIVTVGHELVKTEGKPASCMETGHEPYWVCGRCGKMFSDEEGTEIMAPVEVGKTEHAYGEWTVTKRPVR